RHAIPFRPLVLRKIQSHLAVAFAVLAPVFAYLHEQKEMHSGAEQFLKLLARHLADRLDGLSALSQRDLALALALHIDDLLDADRAVLLLLPAFGFDGERVWQFVMQAQKELFAR